MEIIVLERWLYIWQPKSRAKMEWHEIVENINHLRNFLFYYICSEKSGKDKYHLQYRPHPLPWWFDIIVMYLEGSILFQTNQHPFRRLGMWYMDIWLIGLPSPPEPVHLHQIHLEYLPLLSMWMVIPVTYTFYVQFAFVCLFTPRRAERCCRFLAQRSKCFN